MEIKKNYDLSKLNTFGIQVFSKYFAEINSENQINELFKTEEFKNNEKLFLGQGSNILFTKNFDGLVVLNRLKGIEIIKAPMLTVGVPNDNVGKDSEYVFIKAMGGEFWNDVVDFSIERNLWGIENLALIPGTVGAGPVQNIGAYGVELKDILEEVEAYDIETGEKKNFSNIECEFGYRDSIFKSKFKNKYFIIAVVYKLNKKRNLNSTYKALADYIKENHIEINSSKDLSSVVSNIRMSKLPDPKILGNAGSFFKNVYITKEKFEDLKKEYIDVPSFVEGERIKIPSGWLIEKCGWKGKRIGDVGVYEKQSLILVNYGNAKGEDIKNFSEEIIKDVYQKFGLVISAEVNLF